MSKYNCQQDYFEKIDTEEKAYWLGFLYADGYVRIGKRNSGQLKLKLSTKDKGHIKLFKECISSTHPVVDGIDKVIKNNREYISYSSTFNVYSRKMVDDLISHGCLNNKTFKIRMPNIDIEFIRHFIRGYFDGDGCIHKNKSRPNSFSVVICSNNDFIEDISNLFKIGFITKKKNYSLLTINKIDYIKEFREFIYKDSSIFLNRKHDIFGEIIDNYKRGSISGKNYRLVDPNGVEFITNRLKSFCNDNNLVYSSISNLLRGIGKTNKKWTCEVIKNIKIK